ncbi:hypothetical protein [Treponema sp.]|uniref:hypothetical protein n=1 Tax=Treponema sp. TaxID=166 RepID=UPI00388F8061
MKLRNILIGAAVLASSTALFAQQIHIGGYVDYTSTLAVQGIYSNPDEDWEKTEVAAEFGPVQNGIHFINLDATAANIEFHTGTWLGSGLGPWYADVPEYVDRTKYSGGDYYSTTDDDVSSPVMQMWACTHFFDDQLRFYTGNFAGNGWNAGYIYSGFVLGGQKIENLAMRGTASDSAFSGIEVLPSAFTGFKFIAGLPIAPFTDSYSKFNNWNHLAKSIKLMAQYKWLLYNVTFNGGFRPNTYYTNGAGLDDNYTKSYFSEAFIQVDMPSLFYGILINASYDLRWRKAEERGVNLVSGEDWSATVFAHIIQASAKFTSLVEGWEFGVEDRFGYYTPHYISINETAVYNVLAVNGSHKIPGTQYQIGFEAQFMYGQDANGSANGYDKPDNFDAYCSDLISYDANFMGIDGETAPATGTPGRYYSVYGYPYFQKNFANGNVRIGLELQYKHLKTSNVLEAFAWRVPMGVTFWW